MRLRFTRWDSTLLVRLTLRNNIYGLNVSTTRPFAWVHVWRPCPACRNTNHGDG